MKSDEIKEAMLRQYLLGKLGSDEAENLEQELLADEKLFELAEAVEGDLLAAYARGELSSSERSAVRRRLAASPQGRARLAVSRSLMIISDEAKSRGSVLPFRRRLSFDRPEIRAAALAASLSVVVAGLWLAQQPPVRPGDPRSGVEMHARNETPSPGDLQQPAAAPKTTPPAPAPGTPQTEAPVEREQASPAPTPAPPPEQIAVQKEPEPDVQTVQELQLSLVAVRSSQTPETLELRPGTKDVNVKIPLEEEEDSFSSFTAVVSRTDTGDEVAAWDALVPTTIEEVPVVILSLPADKLSAGRYRIMLHGINAGVEPKLLGAPVFEVRAMDY